MIFTTFYVDLPGKPSGIDKYLPCIAAGQKALAATNPGARYVVLTDDRTEPGLRPHCETVVAIQSYGPLMVRYLSAQIAFLNGATFGPRHDGLTILAATDCIANRDLSQATSDDHGMAVTYRDDNHRINNIAYVRDTDLASRFLFRAFTMLQGFSLEKQEWMGDQESWEAALIPDGQYAATPSETMPPYWQRVGMANAAMVKLRSDTIHLYPCHSHNRFIRKSGVPKQADIDAYIVHFKGDRKQHMPRYVAGRWGDG